jgi:hypothetical protein
VDLRTAYLNLALQVNGVRGRGGTLDVDELSRSAQSGDVLGWLGGRYGRELDLGLLHGDRTAWDTVNDWFSECAAANDLSNFDLVGTDDGLSLLVAWCIDAVQSLLFPSGLR